MYRGDELLEIARHITLYGDTSTHNKFLMVKFDKPSWRKLYLTSLGFNEVDLHTQLRFYDTLDVKYPSVEAFTRALEIILLGDIKPEMRLLKFKFNDEFRPW
jgi:hypothetical protein